jgi:hypothetical protein
MERQSRDTEGSAESEEAEEEPGHAVGWGKKPSWGLWNCERRVRVGVGVGVGTLRENGGWGVRG